MPTTDTNVPQVVVNKLTKAQYEGAVKDPTEFYMVTDEQIETSDIADGAVTSQKIDFTTFMSSGDVVSNVLGVVISYQVIQGLCCFSVHSSGTITSADFQTIPAGGSIYLGILPAKPASRGFLTPCIAFIGDSSLANGMVVAISSTDGAVTLQNKSSSSLTVQRIHASGIFKNST